MEKMSDKEVSKDKDHVYNTGEFIVSINYNCQKSESLDGSKNSKLIRCGNAIIIDTKTNFKSDVFCKVLCACNPATIAQWMFDISNILLKPLEPNYQKYLQHFIEYRFLIPYTSEKENLLFICMENDAQISLDNYLLKNDLQEKDIKCLLKTLMEAIIYCHHRGLILQGLSPDHILLKFDKNNKISEFYISGIEYMRVIGSRKSRYVSTFNKELKHPYEDTPVFGPEIDIFLLGQVMYYACTKEIICVEGILGGEWKKDIQYKCILDLLSKLFAINVTNKTIKKRTHNDLVKLYLKIFSNLEKVINLDNLKYCQTWVVVGPPSEKFKTDNFFDCSEDLIIKAVDNNSEVLQAQFKREEKIWEEITKLNNPYLVPLLNSRFLSSKEHYQGVFVTLDLDKDLSAFITQEIYHRYIAFEEFCAFARQLALAIAALHNENIIHRDIKPQNIFPRYVQVGTEKRIIGALLSDFGLSRKTLPTTIKESPASDKNKKLTDCGTKGFKAPEIYMKQDYNMSCDIYSYGVTLFCVLFKQISIDSIFQNDGKMINQEKIDSILTEYNNNLLVNNIWPGMYDKGALVMDLIKNCMKFNPNERFTIGKVLSCPLFKNTNINELREQYELPYEIDEEEEKMTDIKKYTAPENKLWKALDKDNKEISIHEMLLENLGRYFSRACQAHVLNNFILEHIIAGLTIQENLKGILADTFNIAQLYDKFLHKIEGQNITSICLVTDRCIQLNDFLKERKEKLPDTEMLGIARDILNAIHFLHSQNICHRFLKDKYVYITEIKDKKEQKRKYEAKIGGFIITKMADDQNTFKQLNNLSTNSYYNHRIQQPANPTNTNIKIPSEYYFIDDLAQQDYDKFKELLKTFNLPKNTDDFDHESHEEKLEKAKERIYENCVRRRMQLCDIHSFGEIIKFILQKNGISLHEYTDKKIKEEKTQTLTEIQHFLYVVSKISRANIDINKIYYEEAQQENIYQKEEIKRKESKISDSVEMPIKQEISKEKQILLNQLKNIEETKKCISVFLTILQTLLENV